MRRLLNQAANAAAKTKGSICEIVYRRSVPRLGHNQAIGAIAHRQCRLIWLILHQGVSLRRTRPSRYQANEAKAHSENEFLPGKFLPVPRPGPLRKECVPHRIVPSGRYPIEDHMI